MPLEELVKFIEEKNTQIADLKFNDLPAYKVAQMDGLTPACSPGQRPP